MSPAAQLARLCSHRYVKTEVPDLPALCRDLGLRVHEVPARGFEGALVRSTTSQKGIIAVNAAIRETSRKRFTIAHEIGHFVIPHHRLLGNMCEERSIESFDTRLGRAEVEANEFASELLLPSNILRNRFDLANPSLTQISVIAADFRTSLTATTRSFLGMTNLPCALVWSSGNRARWFARSDAFRFFLPLDDLPAPGSYALGLFDGQDAPSEFSPVPSNAWLDRMDAERVETLLEHSVLLPNYDAVLTLLWAYRGATSATDEDAGLEELEPEEFTLQRRRWPRA